MWILLSKKYTVDTAGFLETSVMGEIVRDETLKQKTCRALRSCFQLCCCIICDVFKNNIK